MSGDARSVRDFPDRYPGLVLIIGHARYYNFFHIFCLSDHHGTPLLCKG